MKKQNIIEIIKESFDEYNIKYIEGYEGADFRIDNFLVFVCPNLSKKDINRIKKIKSIYKVIFVVDKKNIDMKEIANELYTLSHLNCFIDKFIK